MFYNIDLHEKQHWTTLLPFFAVEINSFAATRTKLPKQNLWEFFSLCRHYSEFIGKQVSLKMIYYYHKCQNS